MITDALHRVGFFGLVTMQEIEGKNDYLNVVDGLMFDRGFVSPYFINIRDKMVCEYFNIKILIVEKKVLNSREILGILETSIKKKFTLLILSEDIEDDVITTLIINKLRNNLHLYM